MNIDLNRRSCLFKLFPAIVPENQAVGDSFGRHGATVGICLDEFAAAICEEFGEEFIKLPDTEECKRMMHDFMKQEWWHECPQGMVTFGGA